MNLRWPAYRKRYASFRVGQFRQLGNLKDLPGLCYGSILHILDNMQPPAGGINYGPSVTNPAIALDESAKLLITNVTDPTAVPKEYAPVVNQHMVMTNAGVVSQLMNYRREMSPRVIYFNSIEELPLRVGAQRIVNYNALFRARLLGIRRKPRLMNMVLATLVNTIMRAPNEMHFIHIPLESLMFERKDFARIFKKYDRIATRYPEITSYLFLAHLYSILMKPMIMPPRGVLIDDEEGENAAEEFSIDKSNWDPGEDHSEWFTNIANYMLGNDEIALETLKLKDTENPYKVSVFEYLPAAMFEKVNFLLTCGDQYILYNLRDLKDLNGRSGAGILRIISHVNLLCAGGTPDQVIQEEPPMVAESVIEVDGSGTKANQPEFKMPMTKEEKQDAIDQDLKELDDFEKILETDVTAQTKPLTVAQKEHVKTISKAYKHLKIDGKTFEEVLTTVPEFDIELPELNLDATKEGAISAKATASSTAKLDAAYVQKCMKHDLAAVVTSFNKQGMFLVDFQEEEWVDDLNARVTYTARYEDTNHKKHTFKFTLPKVDQFGNYMDNGSLKTIDKQRVSNPICKVSDTRVTLNSNYNKLLIERNTSVAHSFINWFTTALNKAKDAGFKAQPVHGTCHYSCKAYPFELTELGARYTKIGFSDGCMFFDIENRAINFPEKLKNILPNLEQETGVWFGYKGEAQFFLTVSGQVTVKNVNGDELFYGAFMDFCEWLFGIQLNAMTEYVTATILSREVPVIHALGYRYGLTNMLKYTGCDYEIVDANARIEKRTSDIVIKFSDKKLIIRRNPRNNALLFGGLCIYDFSNISIEDMDDKDIYYELLSQKGISTNFIKGLDPLFDMFIDPITRDVLREMNEPTDIRDLILRAVTMLTTSEHKPAASAANFRFRGVEQIIGVVYNEMSRAFANYKNHSGNGAVKFSISDYQIKQRIAHMQLTENVSLVNPINDIKQYSKFSNTGDGGRSADTFMIPDRQFTRDQIGVVSEATVDNGKTGLNASLPFDPIIVNERGMVSGEIDITKLEPQNVLSVTSLLYPGVTHDDSKRASFVHIQASHYVPIKESEVSRLRTGFEEVIAQRCHNPCFAFSAPKNGTILEVNEENKTLKVQYADGSKQLISYGPTYTNNSANGFYVDQEVAVNGFRKGDRFKAGDILTYNHQFFQADPYSKQVRWKIGTLAKVALLDNGGTIEDASILTQPLCDRMVFNPVHVKEITLTKDTNVHAFADVGVHVTNTDPLIIFDQSAVTFEEGHDDPELMRMLGDLNKSAPKAEHTGDIVQIDVFYKCAIADMSPTLQKIVRHVTKLKNSRALSAEDCANRDQYLKSAPLAGTNKVGITDLTPDTVILKFYIKQNKGMSPGDKLFFDSSLKSVCSTVYPESLEAEDGTKIDAATSCRGILARIITSPFLSGIANSVLEKLENNMLDIWEGKEPVNQNK